MMMLNDTLHYVTYYRQYYYGVRHVRYRHGNGTGTTTSSSSLQL